MANTGQGRRREAPGPRRAAPEDRARLVRRAFSEIAPRYDLLNHLLSLNVDRGWRRRAVSRLGWEGSAGGRFLDGCAGTLDLSAELARRPGFRGTVVAVDFASPMLRRGRRKVRGLPVLPVLGDALRLPFPDAAFDGAMVAFGVRNLGDLDRGLRELARVLRPGGRVVILDFGLPRASLLRALYLFYFRRVLPLVGRLVSGHPWAYDYLPASVMEFPDADGLAASLGAAGFREVEWEPLSGGIAVIHRGVREAAPDGRGHTAAGSAAGARGEGEGRWP